jgi:membrane protease YdiL (CAAX protease family)
MKHKTALYEIIVFSLIFLFLIIPPFFSAPVSDSSVLFTWNFPFRQAGLCVFAVVLFILSRNLNSKKGFFFPSMLSLTLLFFCALVIKLITKSDYKTPLPSTPVQWIFCVLTFLFAAIYEEIIYRFYFCDALFRLVNYTALAGKKWIFWGCEILGVLVFAFAHFYLGIAAVINAAFAHVVLRFLYKKTNLIWNCVLIHFLYNIISLILL